MTITGAVLACAEYSLTPPDSTKKIIVKDRAVSAENKLGCAEYMTQNVQNTGQRHLSQSKRDEAPELIEVHLHSTSSRLLLQQTTH